MLTAELITFAWHKMGYTIHVWATLVIFGAAFITQLLSIFGIAVGINLMVWHYGVFMAGGLVAMVSNFMWLFAYNKGYSVAADETSDGTASTDAGYAWAYKKAAEKQLVWASVKESSLVLEIISHYAEWMHGQIMALPEEERMEILEEAEGKKGEKGEKMYAKFAWFRF